MKTDVIEKMKYIETHYPVETIEYNGIKLWPFFRTYLCTKYYYSDEPVGTGHISTGFLRRFIRAIRFSSIKYLFIRKAALLYTDTGEVRLVDGIYVDKTAAAVIEIENNIIPILSIYGNKEKFAFKKFILLDFFALGILPFSIFFHKRKINNQALFEPILTELGIADSYRKQIRRILAFIWFYTIYFKLIKPKIIYINCYYDFHKLSISFAAKLLRIPVVELQHGLISETHCAYRTCAQIELSPYPDYLLCFGEYFKRIVSPGIYRQQHIFPVGSYYIDRMRSQVEQNYSLFMEKYAEKKDKIIVTVASQLDIDDLILEFVEDIANSSNEFYFIYVPRVLTDFHKQYKHHAISIETTLDVYQCMQNSNITSAVVSTCAVESLAFGTPVVLIDVKGLATFYYKSFFSNTYSVKYANTPQEYIKSVYSALKLDRASVQMEGNDFFADNYDQRLKEAIFKIKKDSSKVLKCNCVTKEKCR